MEEGVAQGLLDGGMSKEDGSLFCSTKTCKNKVSNLHAVKNGDVAWRAADLGKLREAKKGCREAECHAIADERIGALDGAKNCVDNRNDGFLQPLMFFDDSTKDERMKNRIGSCFRDL